MYSEKIKFLIKKLFKKNKTICTTIIGTPAFNTLYNLSLPNEYRTESSPVTSNEVLDYRERHLSPFEICRISPDYPDS